MRIAHCLRCAADRHAFAVVGASRLQEAADGRYLADEYAPELLPDEAVDGEVDCRVEGEKGVAGVVGVAQGSDVELDEPARRELAGRERYADAEVRQLAHDEDRHDGDQHQSQIFAAAVLSSSARVRLRNEQAPSTSADHPQSAHQLGVQHDESDQRSDGAEDKVTGRFVDEKVVSTETQGGFLGAR